MTSTKRRYAIIKIVGVIKFFVNTVKIFVENEFPKLLKNSKKNLWLILSKLRLTLEIRISKFLKKLNLNISLEARLTI